MADEPWRISFPVCIEPVEKVPYLILWQKPIPDARQHVAPTMCHVVGMNKRGQHCKFTVSIAEYNRALLATKHFIEADNIRAPAGGLVDPTGKVLS